MTAKAQRARTISDSDVAAVCSHNGLNERQPQATAWRSLSLGESIKCTLPHFRRESWAVVADTQPYLFTGCTQVYSNPAAVRQMRQLVVKQVTDDTAHQRFTRYYDAMASGSGLMMAIPRGVSPGDAQVLGRGGSIAPRAICLRSRWLEPLYRDRTMIDLICLKTHPVGNAMLDSRACTIRR